jgi:alkylation response protein AidB-like acyl-CoA dehydrogenase
MSTTTPTAVATPEVSFAVTEEQQLLRTTVRDLLAQRATSERVREVMLGTEGFDARLWDELAQLGLTGLAVPEAHGGAGASFVEVAIVAEELGRRLAPVPFLSSAVLGTTALLHAGTDDQRAAHLPAVAAGATRLALAHLDDRGRLTADPGVRAVRDGDTWVLDGTAGYVVDGGTADLLVTAAVTDDGLALFLVPADAAGLTRTAVEVLDLTRPMATLGYEGVVVDAAAHLAGGDPVIALHEALTAGVVAIACEQVGGAQQVLETTTAYARDRVQFGRAIGSFQAVKHRLAELLVQLEAARSTAGHAARVVAADDRVERRIAAPLAASYCAEVFEQVAGDGIQLHGGIGFTWEHDAHLYFKRAKATKLLLGDPKHHRALLAEALGV